MYLAYYVQHTIGPLRTWFLSPEKSSPPQKLCKICFENYLKKGDKKLGFKLSYISCRFFKFSLVSYMSCSNLILYARSILTRGLYILYPIFEDHYFVFKEVFSENSGLMYG